MIPPTPPMEKKETEKEPIKDTIAEDLLKEILIDLKKEHKEVDFSFLSTADQVKAYRQLAKTPAKNTKDVKADINIPLGNPAPTENRIKSFLERQQEAGFGKNLRDMGSLSHVAQKLYEKKNS